MAGLDSLTLPLIRAALERGMPLFCICRGFQELNVVFGGTLATEIQDLPGRLDHRAPDSDDIAIRYGPAHPIAIEPGSLLHRKALHRTPGPSAPWVELLRRRQN